MRALRKGIEGIEGMGDVQAGDGDAEEDGEVGGEDGEAGSEAEGEGKIVGSEEA